MFYIVGLGNPGEEYKDTPHNVGRDVVFKFCKKHKFSLFEFNKKANALVAEGKINKEKTQAILPETFMNKSGSAVEKYVTSIKKAERLIVVHDDLDLPLGRIKIVKSRGSGGHKGVDSIRKRIGTNDFIRLRVGIAQGDSKGRAKKIKDEGAVRQFVLGKWSPKDKKEVKRVEKIALEALNSIFIDGFYKAQNKFNQ